MKKKKSLSLAEKQRRNQASEKDNTFNVKTKGMRDRFTPQTAARLKREEKSIPIKSHQVSMPMIEFVQPSYRDEFPKTTNMLIYSQSQMRQMVRDYGNAGMVPVLTLRR